MTKNEKFLRREEIEIYKLKNKLLNNIGEQKKIWFAATDISDIFFLYPVADSENHIDFTSLALVFEIWAEAENLEFTNFSSFIQEFECY